MAAVLSVSNPAPGNVIHCTQGIEIKLGTHLDETTLDASTVQVHDDGISLDLGVAGRAIVTSVDDETSGTASILRIQPVAGAWWGLGTTIRVTITSLLKYEGGAAVGPAIYTYVVAGTPRGGMLLPGQVDILRTRWRTQDPWSRQRARAYVRVEQAPYTVESAPWEGRPATQDELVSAYRGSYNQGRGALADAELALLRAAFYQLDGSATDGVLSVALLAAWMDDFDPGEVSGGASDWETQGAVYAKLGHLWLDVYERVADLLTPTQVTTFRSWIKKYAGAVHSSMLRTGDTHPRSTRSWGASLIVRVGYLRQDPRYVEWGIYGTSSLAFESSSGINPFPLVSNLLYNGMEASDHTDGGPFPRIWDWRLLDQGPENEAVGPAWHLLAWQTLARLQWAHEADLTLWEYEHPVHRYTLTDHVTELLGFSLAERGFERVGRARQQELSGSSRSRIAWASVRYAQFRAPQARYYYAVLPSNLGGASPTDGTGTFCAPVIYGHPGSSFLSPVAPPAVDLGQVTLIPARTWVRVQWPPTTLFEGTPSDGRVRARAQEAELGFWEVLLDGVSQGRTTDPTFSINGLTPGRRYSVVLRSINEAGLTADSGAFFVRTLDW